MLLRDHGHLGEGSGTLPVISPRAVATTPQRSMRRWSMPRGGLRGTAHGGRRQHAGSWVAFHTSRSSPGISASPTAVCSARRPFSCTRQLLTSSVFWRESISRGSPPPAPRRAPRRCPLLRPPSDYSIGSSGARRGARSSAVRCRRSRTGAWPDPMAHCSLCVRTSRGV